MTEGTLLAAQESAVPKQFRKYDPLFRSHLVTANKVLLHVSIDSCGMSQLGPRLPVKLGAIVQPILVTFTLRSCWAA